MLHHMNTLTGQDIISWAKADDVRESLSGIEDFEKENAIHGVRAGRVEKVRTALIGAIQFKYEQLSVQISELAADQQALHQLFDDLGARKALKAEKLQRRSRVEFSPFTLLVPGEEQGFDIRSYEGRINAAKSVIAPLVESIHTASSITRTARILIEGKFAPEHVHLEYLSGEGRRPEPVKALTFLPDEDGSLEADKLLALSEERQGIGPLTASVVVDIIKAASTAELQPLHR